MMKWNDLNQLETLIQQTKALGTDVQKIGVSGEGRSIYGVTVGDELATRNIALVAGFHADEVIGPLTAISLIRSLVKDRPPTVRNLDRSCCRSRFRRSEC